MNDVIDQEALYDEGMDCIRDGDLEEAMAIGERLQRLGWTGNFELRAAVYEKRGDLDKAIGVLKEGIRLAGGPWLLFSQLGNYLSDAERYDEALEAYHQGQALESTDPIVFRLNRSIVFSRMGRRQDACKELRALESEIEAVGPEEEIYWHFKAYFARELLDGDHDFELAKLCEVLREQIENNGEFAEEKARVASAYACSLARQNEQAASERWWSLAVDLNADTCLAKWQKRQLLQKDHAAGGTVFQILVEGEWPYDKTESGRPFGFIRRYDVLAADPMQAFCFAKEFEPEEIRTTLTFVESTVSEDISDQPKGVYEIFDYRLFDPDLDDEED